MSTKTETDTNTVIPAAAPIVSAAVEAAAAKAEEAMVLAMLSGKTPAEISAGIKTAKKARWNAMSGWQKAGHVAVVAAPFVATAAVAGTAGYALAGGFAQGEGVESVDGIDGLHAVNS